MNPDWRSALASAGAVFDGENTTILNFGDAAGELQAVDKTTVLAPLVHLDVIDCSGEDATGFLHNQVTSDINHLGQAQAQHSAWCTAKGRMQASFLVWRQADSIRLALSEELLEATQKRLQMFILRAKVKLSRLTDRQVLLGIAGPQAGAALDAAGLPVPTEAMAALDGNGCKVIRLDGNRLVVAVPLADAGALWATLSAQAKPVGTATWQLLDIRAGLPVISGATKEEFVPQMADFEKIGGVSFHKGCYPGQEVVARTQYLGKVKRHLYRLTSEQALKAGDDLHSPGNPDQACGKVVSAAPSPSGGYEALAVVQSNYADDVHLDSREGPLLQASAVNP